MATMSGPKEGGKAPDFSAKNETGKTMGLEGMLGRKVVLYFYPKDDTPGCVMEACSFRDNIRLLASKGVVILGMSPDSAESHNKFKKKYKLNFSLLSDVSKDICTKYGVLKPKNFMGKEFVGVERTTFIINEKGTVEKVFRDIDPADHVKEIIEFLDSAEI